ncbi:hypothetical protein ACPWT1_15290 [Ramlibacter sp. MMS24-I3-19]|uniref:hypothetical protein n=1 Tax=Ramlibacter sp. MMS24-I3-19 TaxID=3416606 RepID=UPI003D053ED5
MHAANLHEMLALLPAETRERLVVLYLDLLGPGLTAVEATLHQHPAQAAQPLHRLAGGAAMLQDHGVAQLARSLERALLEGDVEQALAGWPALQAAAEHSRQALQHRTPG